MILARSTVNSTKLSAKPQVTAKEEQSLADAMDKTKRKQEIQDLQNKLLAMAAKDTRTVGPDIPLGMPEGTGTEEGVSTDAWLHEFLKQAWRLSKYQLGRTDLSAEVQLTFDGKGRLLNYKFLAKSADPRFDDSVVRAVLQLKDYPEETVITSYSIHYTKLYDVLSILRLIVRSCAVWR